MRTPREEGETSIRGRDSPSSLLFFMYFPIFPTLFMESSERKRERERERKGSKIIRVRVEDGAVWGPLSVSFYLFIFYFIFQVAASSSLLHCTLLFFIFY